MTQAAMTEDDPAARVDLAKVLMFSVRGCTCVAPVELYASSFPSLITFAVS